MTLVSDARVIARAGIRAVDPAQAVRRCFVRTDGGYRVGRSTLPVGADGQLRIVAIGKAAAAMGDAAYRIGRDGPVGVAVTPQGYPVPRSDLRVVFGDHPVPRARSFRAGLALLEFVDEGRPQDAVLFLLSGGGSAVAELPAGSLRDPDLTRTTEILLASGAPIGKMNALRRHISRLKGGQLARAGCAGSFATIALSDVVGDVPSDIASGPTVPDPSTFREALDVVRTYGIGTKLPDRVLRYLEEGRRGLHPETPKPGDRRFRHAPFILAATNRTALSAAAGEARRRRYETRIIPGPLVGETQPVAEEFARRLLTGAERSRAHRFALLAGGETTVTLGRHPGLGGRNQEFALATASTMDGRDAMVLSIGTDGIDGPTDAAGGWTDGGTLRRARWHSIDLARVLRSHSSYEALQSLGGLVRTGPTGTNVMDLHVGLVRAPLSPGTAENSRPSAVRSSRRTRS